MKTKTWLLSLTLLVLGAIATPAQTTYQPIGYHINNYDSVSFYYRLSDGTAMTLELANCSFGIAYGTARPDPQGMFLSSCSTATKPPYVYTKLPSATLNLALANGSTRKVTLAPTNWKLLRTSTWRGVWKYTMVSYSTGITVE
jgi:hypothetical protein